MSILLSLAALSHTTFNNIKMQSANGPKHTPNESAVLANEFVIDSTKTELSPNEPNRLKNHTKSKNEKSLEINLKMPF